VKQQQYKLIREQTVTPPRLHCRTPLDFAAPRP
jgi:hypothetical protein